MGQRISKNESSGNNVGTTGKGIPVIRGAMLLDEILAQLTAHGCADITEQINLSRCSQEAVSNGGFGDVYCGALVDGTRVALKCFRLLIGANEQGYKQLKHAARELYVWSKCSHPNILPLIGVAKYHDRLAMVSPWMENGNLSWFLSKQPELDRCALCVQIADGVAYLHSEGIVHGDIKGANILVSQDYTPKVTDFGNATMKDYTLGFTNTTSTPSFSLRWAAPEIFEGKTTHSFEADVYALGMTILETITGSVPYNGLGDVAVVMRIVNGAPPERPEQHIPTDNKEADLLWLLLMSCWASDPRDRPTAAKVRDKMKLVTREGLMGSI